MIFLTSALCVKLKSFCEKENIEKGTVFRTKNGNAINRSNVWKMMKNLCEEANVGYEKVFPHNLRHLFARTFYDIEKDLGRLADVLGHTNINTTRIYTMETGDYHEKQIEKLNFLL